MRSDFQCAALFGAEIHSQCTCEHNYYKVSWIVIAQSRAISNMTQVSSLKIDSFPLLAHQASICGSFLCETLPSKTKIKPPPSCDVILNNNRICSFYFIIIDNRRCWLEKSFNVRLNHPKHVQTRTQFALGNFSRCIGAARAAEQRTKKKSQTLAHWKQWKIIWSWKWTWKNRCSRQRNCFRRLFEWKTSYLSSLSLQSQKLTPSRQYAA